MSSIEYIFKGNYDNLPGISIPFKVANRFDDIIYDTDISTTNNISTYADNFGGIVVYPFFNDLPLNISDSDFFIDFGDGTIVRENLSAAHTYKVAGDYMITLVVAGSAGSFFKSKNQYIAKVRNVIPDKVFLTFEDENSQNMSEATSKILVTRYNSSVTSPYLSSNDYSIKLSVKGNLTPLIGRDNYIKSDDFQYKPGSYFISSPDSNFEVIDSVKTSSTDIYAKYQGSNIVFEFTPSTTNEFVGTSGHGYFYYIEDTSE
jgi:PKD repeat protein